MSLPRLRAIQLEMVIQCVRDVTQQDTPKANKQTKQIRKIRKADAMKFLLSDVFDSYCEDLGLDAEAITERLFVEDFQLNQTLRFIRSAAKKGEKRNG